jgi:formylglycine-generating enzyme required for sulfatase activity
MKTGILALGLLLSALLLLPGCAGRSGKTRTNSIGMEFVLIPAGSFVMGSASGYNEEIPEHPVTISRPFYLGKYEVTQAQWEAVMGENSPSRHKGPANPVENVSWEEVREFIEKLNKKEGTARYRLPTEAEWEYAARAGTDTPYFFGNDKKELSEYAWHGDNSRGRTHPAGEKRPNPWGLYDIYGNVWEWVEDWFDENFYADSPEADPRGPEEGSRRVFRGGGWEYSAEECRSATRGWLAPADRVPIIGFRLVFSK